MASVSCGIVGLANAGKSTLFNALLKKQVAQSANYPFTTIEPNVGIVEVPDTRLEKLKEVVEKSEGLSPNFQIIPAVVKFVDIAGLVKGAHRGEGLGNRFLSHIREVDVIVFVVRDFKAENVIKTGENPKEDLEVLKEELLLKDLETIEKRIDSLERELRGIGAVDLRHNTLKTLRVAKDIVSLGKWLGDEMSKEELEKINELQLLSLKKTIIVLNSDEGDLDKELSTAPALRISAKLEEEISGLSEKEQSEYLGELGFYESGINRLIRLAYKTLGLITFFTAGPKEVRAWTIREATLAPMAAGVIHSDFERGFIAADTLAFDAFIKVGGWQRAREAGVVRTIGKSEEIKDGYVVEFKFSV